MTKFEKISLFLLRVGLGWFFFYAGITKVLDPSWSAAGYLQNAKTFSGFFAWFASPGILPVTNFLNEWGLTILGASLILGIFVRFSSGLGIILMLLYFAPIRAGRVYGLENWCSNLPICSRFPKLRNWLG